MIDLDRYREILDTLARNKSRSLLTGFGIFWGVFMLVALIGGGNGMQEMLSNNFKGFATNSALVWANQTTKPYKGLKKGRSWSMNYGDVNRLKDQVTGLDVVAPLLSRWGSTAIYGDRKTTVTMKGVQADYREVEVPQLFYGRYINDMDIDQRRKVCVLGKKVYKALFTHGENPCGKRIEVNKVYYNVVGVDYNTGEFNVNGSAEESIVIPISLMQQVYSLGDSVQIICMTGKPGVDMNDVTQQVRQVIAGAHYINPSDEQAIKVFNTSVMFGMVDYFFQGIHILIWMVGIGTLLAGAIGVSNIMMVTVKERTTEIGIRRAIGATPRKILMQIISESMALTAVAGMSGILFAVFILQLLEIGNTEDGILKAHFQIPFWTAIGATLFLSLLGVCAGLLPAFRAMGIKPVDAMRDA